MKSMILLTFAIAFICADCINRERYAGTFNEVILGGPDIHGELYRKRYYSSVEDAPFHYNQWSGYAVSSNRELEMLLEAHPDCKAIKFDFWTQDGTDTTEFALSEVIGEFDNLKYLEISSNRINRYPSSIEKLTSLEELVIQMRNKDSIEFSFSGFSNLRHLTIHHADDLRAFPFSIFELNNLISVKLFRFFQVSENVLNGLERLDQLQELYIWDSNLTLPQGYRGTTKLQTFIIDGGPSRVDREFFEITSMKRLGLTRVDTLDLSELSRLSNLEAVSLSYNAFYKNKISLPKLKHLSITSFRGNNLDIGIENLPALESLEIWDCDQLTTLDNFSAPTLRSITINASDKLKEVHFDLKKLNHVEEVFTQYNKILVLPLDSIHGVPILKK